MRTDKAYSLQCSNGWDLNSADAECQRLIRQPGNTVRSPGGTLRSHQSLQSLIKAFRATHALGAATVSDRILDWRMGFHTMKKDEGYCNAHCQSFRCLTSKNESDASKEPYRAHQ